MLDEVTVKKQAKKLIEAGEFMLAVQAIHEQHEIAQMDDEGSPYNDRTIAGLMNGLKLVGAELLSQGFDTLERIEKAPSAR
ncbi:hypothetical protein ABIE61_001811 [Marinobacterium sp. MBR-111]|uniref:hypothetical protein n=1 Tax=Marinobacterium sp. MBR-111 TaxID=3156463 RepID=UPI003391404B